MCGGPQVAADRAPPLLDVVAALAAAPQLAPVLADGSAAGDGGVVGAAWATEERLGSRYWTGVDYDTNPVCICCFSTSHESLPAHPRKGLTGFLVCVYASVVCCENMCY